MQEINNLNLREARKKLGLTQKQLAEKLGVSTNTVQNYEYGGTIPETKRKILGELLSFNGDEIQEEADPREPASYNQKINSNAVPLINLDVRGGYDSPASADAEHTERLIPWQHSLPGDFAAPVTGDSMLPFLPSGTIIVLREIPDWRSFLELHHLYVVELYDGRRLLKLVDMSPQGCDFVNLHSYNPEFPDQDLPLSLVRRFFKVIGTIRDLGF